MEPYKLFVACGPFSPQLAVRVREEYRHRVMYDLAPDEAARTDFRHCGLIDEPEKFCPAAVETEGEDWEHRTRNGYYRALVKGASWVYAFAVPALSEHADALSALTAACDALGRRLTLFLY